MTPKEKAIELVNKYMCYAQNSKECALIAVDEIRSCIKWNHYPLDKEWRFWQEVKQEIENI
jgi:hypothetical protein